MRKLLLTGSRGFLASRFYEYYKDQYDFILLDRQTIDITDEAQVYRLFREEKIDLVFHTAAIADIDRCQANVDLAYRTNVRGTVNLAKGCALRDSVLVFASSDQVFSANTEDGPFTEADQPVPANSYAETKIAAEQAIASTVERFYNLRLTWMFSMPEKNKKPGNGIMLKIIRALMEHTPIVLNRGDRRGITYVYEVIENFNKIIELPYGTYHTGSENDLSVYETGEIILDALGVSQRSGEILRCMDTKRDLRISNQKLKSAGVCFTDTEQAVRRCISEFGY